MKSPFGQTKPADDAFNASGTSFIPALSEQDERIGFSNASFSWNETSSRPADSRGSRSSLGLNRFELRLENDVLFKKGKFNMIIGPSASGKVRFAVAQLLHIIVEDFSRRRC